MKRTIVLFLCVALSACAMTPTQKRAVVACVGIALGCYLAQYGQGSNHHVPTPGVDCKRNPEACK